MGRYRSSPTCSYCYEDGHTKRSCPHLREKAENWLANNPDAGEYDKPYYVREVEGYKNIAKNRKCSWCEQTGHTKRSCPKRKEAIAKNISKNKEWRAEVLEKLKKMGFGEGALIQDSRPNPRTYMVEKMNWDKLNVTASGDQVLPNSEYDKWRYKNGAQYPEFATSLIGSSLKTSQYYPTLLDDEHRELLYYGKNTWKIISPVEPTPPSGWIDDESWAKKLF